MKTFRQMVDDIGYDMNLDLDSGDTNALADRDAVKRYLNEGQEELARRLQRIKEDYFVTDYTVPYVNGVSEYALPEDIYAHKVRKVAYIENDIFTVLEKVSFNDYINYSSPVIAGGAYPYGYYLVEKSNPDVKSSVKRSVRLILIPTRGLQNVMGLTVYYIRQVTPMAMDTDTPDIPGTEAYLEAYTRREIALRDPSRTSESFVEEYSIKMKNILESYTDRTPQEGGEYLEIGSDQLDMSRSHVEDL